jgi:deoxyxylulose-5-phosphate synthase
VTIENGTLAGGFSSALREALSNSPSSRVIGFGWPDEFISQGTVEELERDFGFTAEAIAAQVLKEMKGR